MKKLLLTIFNKAKSLGQNIFSLSTLLLAIKGEFEICIFFKAGKLETRRSIACSQWCCKYYIVNFHNAKRRFNLLSQGKNFSATRGKSFSISRHLAKISTPARNGFHILLFSNDNI